jgi:hypothetical protein
MSVKIVRKLTEGEKKFQHLKSLVCKGIRYRWTVLMNVM